MGDCYIVFAPIYMSNEMDNSDFNSNGLVLRIKSIFSLMPGPKCEINKSVSYKICTIKQKSASMGCSMYRVHRIMVDRWKMSMVPIIVDRFRTIPVIWGPVRAFWRFSLELMRDITSFSIITWNFIPEFELFSYSLLLTSSLKSLNEAGLMCLCWCYPWCIKRGPGKYDDMTRL